MDEDTAADHHSPYLAYQSAKAKYRTVLKGLGVNQDEMKKRAEERSKLAKQRSYCSVANVVAIGTKTLRRIALVPSTASVA